MGAFFNSYHARGKIFFLTLVDDFSRFTWLHLMQNKSEARQFIKKLHAMLLTHFGVLIKTVRTDNELEFNMPEFFEEHGIVH